MYIFLSSLSFLIERLIKSYPFLFSENAEVAPKLITLVFFSKKFNFSQFFFLAVEAFSGKKIFKFKG